MAEQGLEGSQTFYLLKLLTGVVHTPQNIVSTVNLDCKLDLKEIASRFRNAVYYQKRFDVVVMTLREPKTAALIYASGKVVCTGAKSVTESNIAALKYMRIMLKLGFSPKFKGFKILKFPTRHGAFSSVKEETCTAFENMSLSDRNIVSTFNLDCKLDDSDLKTIASQARDAEYNPERFDAVVVRIREPKTAAFIYASGKVVCTGAKRDNDSKLAARKYYRIIQMLGFSVKFKDFKILKFPMRQSGLAHSHGVKEETCPSENMSISDVPEGTRPRSCL